jgi:hypothetical protein
VDSHGCCVLRTTYIGLIFAVQCNVTWWPRRATVSFQCYLFCQYPTLQHNLRMNEWSLTFILPHTELEVCCLDGYETWSLTLRYIVWGSLRKVSRRRRSSEGQSNRKLEKTAWWNTSDGGGHVACKGGREMHRGFRLGNLNRLLGRPSHRWEDIKRVLKNNDGMI